MNFTRTWYPVPKPNQKKIFLAFHKELNPNEFFRFLDYGYSFRPLPIFEIRDENSDLVCFFAQIVICDCPNSSGRFRRMQTLLDGVLA